MKGRFQHAVLLIGIIVTGIAFGLGARYLAAPWLLDVVRPTEGSIERWVADYVAIAIGLVALATSVSLVWYALGAWGMRVVKWKDGYRRSRWLLLFGLVAVAVIGAGFATPSFERGGVAVYATYLVLGVGLFYVATLLFSPVNHKYAPFGATRVRGWLGAKRVRWW